MMLRGLPIAIGLVVAAGAFWSPASAGVVVLTNRAEGKVALTIIQPDGRQTRHGLDRGEVIPVPVADAVTIVFNAGGEPRRRLLQANGIYYFHTDGNKLDLVQYPLPGLSADRPMPKPLSRQRDDLCTIPVKILVDDKEPTVRRVWEKRYRERMAEASEIIAGFASRWWRSAPGPPTTVPASCGNSSKSSSEKSNRPRRGWRSVSPASTIRCETRNAWAGYGARSTRTS